MSYAPFDASLWPVLSPSLARAEDALARLDQTLAKSPIRAGWSARSDFADAAASLWIDGSLIAQDDLVLHDARMDIRTPTHELGRAHAVLRARRRILGSASADPGWALSQAGLKVLRGRFVADAADNPAADAEANGLEPASETDDPKRVAALENADDEDPLAAEFFALDAAMARTDKLLAERSASRPEPDNIKIILYDLDWDEDARLQDWRDAVRQTETLPPVLAAVLAAKAWDDIEPLQRAPWLVRLLVPALLQARGKTRFHLASLNVGLKTVLRARRTHRDPTVRLLALIEAIEAAADLGLKNHDRWMLAREVLQRKLLGRRATSKLPALIDLVMATPVVSAGMIARDLKITPRGAQNLVAALGLREATGRGRYRAWGVL